MPLRSSVIVTGNRPGVRDDPARLSGMSAPRDRGSAAMASQTWEFREFPGPRPDGENNAVVFLNEPARQRRGEATATLRNDGSAGLFYRVPGDLGASTRPTGESRNFPSPDGEKNAVIFLNEPARQGPGEATVT